MQLFSIERVVQLFVSKCPVQCCEIHDFRASHLQSERQELLYRSRRTHAEADNVIDVCDGYVARVIEVGLVASFSVQVISEVEPSTFFTVTVVPETARSSRN